MAIEVAISALGGATFSECGAYRFSLWRELAPEKPLLPRHSCLFVMLNPSTADHEANDPTVARCVRYATRWGFSRLYVANIFAYRSTDPKALYRARFHGYDPVGAGNNEAILALAREECSTVIAAWGVHGSFEERGAEVAKMLREAGVRLSALGVTKHGHPKHPLYLRGDALPSPYVVKAQP